MADRNEDGSIEEEHDGRSDIVARTNETNDSTVYIFRGHPGLHVAELLWPIGLQRIDPKILLCTVALIHESVDEIPDHTFGDCVNLRKLTLHSNLTRIGRGAFALCESLCSVNWKEASSLTHIGDDAFFGAGLVDVTLPDSLTHVGEEAFSSRALKRIHFPARIQSMGHSVCYLSSNLEHVTLSEGMTFLPPQMFEGCGNLRQITIPSTVRVIGDYAFFEAKKLREIIWKSESQLHTLGNCSFAHCVSLERVWLPDSLQDIAGGEDQHDTFYNCAKLLQIRFPPHLLREGIGTVGRLFHGWRDSLVRLDGLILDEMFVNELNGAILVSRPRPSFPRRNRRILAVFHSDGKRRIPLGDKPRLWPRILAPLGQPEEADFFVYHHDRPESPSKKARVSLVWNLLRENVDQLLDQQQQQTTPLPTMGHSSKRKRVD